MTWGFLSVVIDILRGVINICCHFVDLKVRNFSMLCISNPSRMAKPYSCDNFIASKILGIHPDLK